MTLTFALILTLILIGFASGVLSGLVGVGGGIIIVPALIYFVAFSSKQAQGTSLAVLTLPVVALGMFQYYKQGFIDYRYVLLLASGFVFGGYFGSKLALTLPDALLKKIFAILLILVALKILLVDSKTDAAKSQTNIETKDNAKP